MLGEEGECVPSTRHPPTSTPAKRAEPRAADPVSAG